MTIRRWQSRGYEKVTCDECGQTLTRLASKKKTWAFDLALFCQNHLSCAPAQTKGKKK